MSMTRLQVATAEVRAAEVEQSGTRDPHAVAKLAESVHSLVAYIQELEAELLPLKAKAVVSPPKVIRHSEGMVSIRCDVGDLPGDEFIEGSQLKALLDKQQKEKTVKDKTTPPPTMTKELIILYLRRNLRDAEALAAVDHEQLARVGATYAQRQEAEKFAEPARQHVEALRIAIDCVEKAYARPSTPT